MKDGHLKICRIELGPWKKHPTDWNADIYERSIIPSIKNFRDLKIRVQRINAGIWEMDVWDELAPLSEYVEKWNHITIGKVDHGIVLDAADEFLERVEKLTAFE